MNHKKISNAYNIALAISLTLVLLNIVLTLAGLSPFQLIYPM
jgi:hypothetical protein